MQEEIYLFMDANIYLKFYSYSPVDLSTLDSIANELNNKHFKIVINSLIKDEYFRRREDHIKEILKADFNIVLNKKIPTLFANYSDEYNKFQKDLGDFKKLSKKLGKSYDDILKRIKQDCFNYNLKPDIAINKIFESAKNIKITKEIKQKSVTRMHLNNPPGSRKNQLGDRIHWESLLSGLKDDGKLIIISNDCDFSSVIDNSKLNLFLIREWESKKNKPVELFKNISDFLNKYLPQFELQDETTEIIDSLIKSLKSSFSFKETHQIISELSNYYKYFNKKNIQDILNCYRINNQIYLIIDDNDIQQFLSNIKKHSEYDEEFENPSEKV